MDNHSYNSYPESGNSSPRSREIEFENPPPWDDQQLSYKVKFMCSYGGKILPRSHDNQLSYVGGETKILSVERNIRFTALLSKLSSLGDSDVTFKYQLPGEDLDALISVTNDDDLDHMMHEFDRLYRSSGKQARIRLFLFTFSRNDSFSSDGGRSDREQFLEDLNSVPNNSVEPAKPPVLNNVDFLFGLDKGISPPPPPVAVKVQDQVPEPVASPPEFSLRPVSGDRIAPSDPIQNQIEIPKHMQEFQRLQINLEHEQSMYTRKSDENLGGYSGDYYVQKWPDKTLPVPSSGTGAPALTAPVGYWPEKHISNGGFPGNMTTTTGAPPEVYMLQYPGTLFHAPGHQIRPVALQATNQGFYPMHRVPSDPYREHQMYNIVPHPTQQFLSPSPQPTLPSQPSRGTPAYSEGISVVRPSTGGGNISMVSDTGSYTQVAYDSVTGRQVYYTVPGGLVQPQVPAPYSAMPVTGSAPGIGPDGQFVTKASPGSV